MYWSQILELIKLFVFLILIFFCLFVCFSFLMGKPKHTLEFTYAVMMWLYYDSRGPVEIVDTGLKS